MARRQLYFSLSSFGYVVGVWEGEGVQRGHFAWSLNTHQATSDSSGIATVWQAVQNIYRIDLLLFYVQLANCVYCR